MSPLTARRVSPSRRNPLRKRLHRKRRRRPRPQPDRHARLDMGVHGVPGGIFFGCCDWIEAHSVSILGNPARFTRYSVELDSRLIKACRAAMPGTIAAKRRKLGFTLTHIMARPRSSPARARPVVKSRESNSTEKATHKLCVANGASILVPRRGLEPLCREAHAPQACVSTNFTTSARAVCASKRGHRVVLY